MEGKKEIEALCGHEFDLVLLDDAKSFGGLETLDSIFIYENGRVVERKPNVCILARDIS